MQSCLDARGLPHPLSRWERIEGEGQYPARASRAIQRFRSAPTPRSQSSARFFARDSEILLRIRAPNSLYLTGRGRRVVFDAAGEGPAVNSPQTHDAALTSSSRHHPILRCFDLQTGPLCLRLCPFPHGKGLSFRSLEQTTKTPTPSSSHPSPHHQPNPHAQR